MIDKFDYAEPACPLGGGKDFYYPDPAAPLGNIPVARVLARVDALFARNDHTEAGRLLEYWRDEAIALGDTRGELSMESELVGFYRKTDAREKGLASVARALALTEELGQEDMASGATVFINCATAYKAFDMPAEALPLYRRAEAVYRETLGEGDARFAGLYNNMAVTLAALGQAKEAEEAYLAALAVLEALPQSEADAAITHVNLAHLYEAMDAADKIREHLMRAYTLLQSESLPRDGYYAFVLEKCAPSFAYFGNDGIYEEFKKEYEAIYAGS